MSCSAVRRLDLLGYRESWIHSRDSRSKLIAVAVFLLCVASFPKYEVAALIPFFVVPLLWAQLGSIPLNLVCCLLITVAPFPILLGIANPILDQQPAFVIGGFSISGGWLSFLSIFLRFILSGSIILVFVATTSMPRIFNALLLLRIPRVFVLQLNFIYRYLFMFIEEGHALRAARSLRDVSHKLPSMRIAAQMLATLLVRSMERAQRIFLSMKARGFDGSIEFVRNEQFTFLDVPFALVIIAYCFIARCFPLTTWVGEYVKGMV